jgi:hypothetical protein
VNLEERKKPKPYLPDQMSEKKANRGSLSLLGGKQTFELRARRRPAGNQERKEKRKKKQKEKRKKEQSKAKDSTLR